MADPEEAVMAERLADLEQRLLVMQGLINAQHALLVIFIADIHLAALEDPEKRLAEFREELFHVTKNMISEKPAAATGIIVAAMEQHFELILTGLQGRMEAELRRRRGEPPRPIPAVLLGSPPGKKPN